MTTKQSGKGDAPASHALSPVQARMARAALQWSLDEAAAGAGVSRRTILRLENDQRDIQEDKVASIRRCYEAAGLRFPEGDPDAGAVVAPLGRALPPQ